LYNEKDESLDRHARDGLYIVQYIYSDISSIILFNNLNLLNKITINITVCTVVIFFANSLRFDRVTTKFRRAIFETRWLVSLMKRRAKNVHFQLKIVEKFVFTLYFAHYLISLRIFVPSRTFVPELS